MVPQPGPYCARCGHPIFGQPVVVEAGLVHPECARSMVGHPAAPRSRKAPAWIFIVGPGLLVLTLITIVAMERLEKRDKELREAKEAAVAQQARDEAAAAEQRRADDEKKARFLWCDPGKSHCESGASTAIEVFATQDDFTLRHGRLCSGGKRTCVEPRPPAFKAPAGTRVQRTSAGLAASSVRILAGPHEGKTGVVDKDHVHDSPPAK